MNVKVSAARVLLYGQEELQRCDEPVSVEEALDEYEHPEGFLYSDKDVFQAKRVEDTALDTEKLAKEVALLGTLADMPKLAAMGPRLERRARKLKLYAKKLETDIKEVRKLSRVFGKKVRRAKLLVQAEKVK